MTFKGRSKISLDYALISGLVVPLIMTVSGCAGIESSYFYKTQEVSNFWHVYPGTPYENKTNSGTAFELRTEDYSVLVQLIGNWSGWDMRGPLPFPIVPLKSPGEFIDVTYQITNPDEQRRLVIDDIRLLLDGTKELPILQRDSMGSADIRLKARYRFERPHYVPNTVAVEFRQALHNGNNINLPTLNLTLRSEKCYWVGDTNMNYVNCEVHMK